jgi:UDP-2,3-diacylglucosamine pyrophosphatase LpxH
MAATASAAATAALLDDERQRVAQMCKIPFQSILVVSDLHLGLGVDAVSTRWARTENFFCDQSFRRAVTWFREGRTLGGAKAAGQRLLVLNGDIFDFLRITPVPTAEECEAWAQLLNALGRPTTADELVEPGPVRSERRFGLRTNDYKSVWKLLRVLVGHRQFREALSDWVKGGDVILFVKGNHDVELYWPLVHAALRELLGGDDTNVLFAQDFVQIANVYIEHGHQYESMTAVKGLPYLENDPNELNLPPGSFVNRYLVNPLERSEPFLDNMKPQTDMIANFIKRHPLRAIRMLWQSGRFLVRSIKARRFWDSSGVLVYLLGLALPLLTLAIIGVAKFSPRVNTLVNGLLAGWKIPAAVLGIVAPYLLGALHEVYQWFRDWVVAKRHPIGDDDYGRKLAETLPGRLDLSSGSIEYLAVLGHTHRLDRQVLPLTKGLTKFTVTYLNTGTWAPLWPKDRPDLLGRTLHPMLLLDRAGDGFTPSQLEWSDAEGKGVECVILMP